MCHSREGGNPCIAGLKWTPASAGVTVIGSIIDFEIGSILKNVCEYSIGKKLFVGFVEVCVPVVHLPDRHMVEAVNLCPRTGNEDW